MNNFSELIKMLHEGEVIILPTETVYGIACLPEFEHKLNVIKQRENQPIARVYKSAEQAISDFADLHPYCVLAMQRMLPGPFTLLVGYEHKIGIRVPDHALCLEFLHALDRPLVMTSANMHSEPAAVTYDEAHSIFPDLRGLDGGRTQYAQASAIVDIRVRK